MEKDIKEVKATKDRILTENNESNTVATIYCTCNGSKLFETSRSSVQSQLVDQHSFNFSGLAQPNFCELDIITKNEKVNTVIKFFPLQTTSAKLKGLPMINKIPSKNRVFRRTIGSLDKKINEKSSEVLQLEKILKNRDSVSDGVLETNASIRDLNKSKKVEKHGKHKPKKNAEKFKEHRRKPTIVNSDNSTHCTSFIDNKEILQKYDNLVNAKTMYFVNLPNKIDSVKKKKKRSNLGVEAEKGTVDTKEEIQKSANESELKDCAVEKMKEEIKTDYISKSIIINKIENEISQWNSVNSQSTLCTTKERTASEISVDCSFYSNKKSSSKRIHNNSPTSDVTIHEIMVEPDKHSRKRKQKKRHENSKQTSTDEELKKKIEDLSKITKKQTTKRSLRGKHSSAGNVGKKSQKSERISNEIKKDMHTLNISKQNIQEEGREEEEELKVGISKRKRKIVNRKHSKKRGDPKQAVQQTNPGQKLFEAENERLQNILKENNVAEENNKLEINKSQDNEMKVIFKDKTQEFGRKKHLRKRNYSCSTHQTKNAKLEAASVVSRNKNNLVTSKECEANKKENNSTKENDADSDFIDGKEKTQNLQPTNLQPIVSKNDKPKGNSVLKLYFVDKLAPSTSSLKLTDDFLLKLKAEKRKHASLRSRSKRRPCASLITDNQVEKQKRRSKSRVTKEEICKSRTQHRSKADVEQQKSRKSASDVSRKRFVENFDISASVEGKFESMKQKQKDLPNNTEKIKLDKPFRNHAKKSKASLSLSTTAFQNNWPKYPGKDSYWTEGISTFTEKFSQKTIRKENRKWSKSCTRKKYEFVCQYSEEENKTKSDTSVNKRNPESKRSKSLITKVRTGSVLPKQTSVTQSSAKEKFYEELCKLGIHQNIQSNNRFRVIPKPIRNKDSSTTNKNNESFASDTKSYKLKPHPSSEKEKEAILNLFKQSNMTDSSTKNAAQNTSGTKLQTIGVRKKRRNHIRTKTKCSSSSSEEEARKSLAGIHPKRKKRIRKCLFRREVSFTHLNVTPVQELYRKRSRILVTKTSLSPEVLFSKKIKRVNLALGKGFASKSRKTQDTDLQHPVLFKKNVEEKVSEKKICNRKLSFFHMTSAEKILEISTRAIANDGNTTVGFTVSGTEPPRRLKNGVIEKTVSEKSCNLHMTFLSPVEINERSGFENAVPTLDCPTKNKNDDGVTAPQDVKVNKGDIIKVVKEMPLSFVPSTHLTRKKTSSLITYRRISKLRSHRRKYFRSLWKVGIPKVAQATNKKINSVKYYEKCPNGFEKRDEVKKESDVKSCFNKLKLCRFRQTKGKNNQGHTVFLPKSTLQIIKEESHSTDSSRCRDRIKEKPNMSTDIKNTQTDFESNDDIIKMKELINYLYSAIEQNKNLNSKTEIKTSEKYLQTEKPLDSSTETSSYEGRFHETKKNEKLNRFKKIIKLSNQKVNEASNSKSLQNTHAIKIKNEVVKRCNKSSPITTGSSSYENTSSTSNHKSPSTQQSSSGDVLSSSYFQKYKATKALIDSKKKAKMESQSDKAVLTSVKSTLEKFETTNKSTVNVKVDKNIGTVNDENILVDQEQNTSEKQPNFVEDAVKNGGKTSAATTLKKFEDKSLQTSNHINDIVQVESNLQSNEIYLYAEKNVSNSTNSDSNAIVEKVSKSPKEKTKKKKFQKSPSTFEKLKRVFGPKEQKYIKNEVMTYNMSEKVDSDVKIVSECQSPDVDYINFIMFERHLEQVLGLYPSIFKAIRAQMDVTVAKNKEIREKTSDLFQSKSTLATTVDTVTEYKNTECYEKSPRSINNVNNDCLEHCCNCYHVWHKKYVVQQYMNSQDFGLRSRKHAENIKQQKAFRRKIEENRANKYDSTSSMKVSRRLKKNRAKCVRQTRKQNFEETCGLRSLTSVYSNDKGFISSCSSMSLDEKWSIASPLYGRTTSCEDLSAAQHNVAVEKSASTSSQSLNVNKNILPSEGRKSKSLIEVSTKKSVNRKLTLKQLLSASVHEQNNLMQALADECQPNIFLMSVSSSCTVFTTPSKFLAKVEKHLQIEKTLSPPETASKAVGEDLVTENVLPKGTPKVDEKLYHKILFPNAAKHLKINAIPKANRQKPFYIHNPSDYNSEQELDSLEVTSPQPVQVKNEEDDFSADSLEIIKCPPKSCNYNMLYTSTAYVKPANQTYLVYSNTVQYDKKLSKQTDRDKRSSKHRKTDEADKKRSTGVSDQNVSNTLISESGYESTKSKRTASIRNFFKKGGSLLDMFRSSTKTTKTQKIVEKQNASNFTNFSNLGMKKEGVQNIPKKDVGTSLTKDKSSGLDKDKVYWHSINKDKKVGKHEKKATNYKTEQTERQSEAKSKCPEIKFFPTSPLSFSLKSYKKQKDECHAYAEKVLLESQLRKEGYYKQYRDFKEMPLELLIGKKMPCKPKLKHQQTSYVQASPKSTPMSIQTNVNAKESEAPHSLVKRDTVCDLETDKKSAPKAFVTEEKIILQSHVTETNQAINAEQLKQDVTPSLRLNNKSKKEVRLQNLEERNPLELDEKSSTRIIITKSKISVEEFDKSNLSTNTFQDPEMSSTKISEDLNSKSSEESSDGFHELYVNSSRLRNNTVGLTELTQFIKSESKIAEDFKSKVSEESFDLPISVTRNEAKKTQFSLESRSKTLEDTSSSYSEKSKSNKSFKLPFGDHTHQNIAETSEFVSKSRANAVNSNSRISEQSSSNRTHELHASDSGHQMSVINILETTKINLKSRKRTKSSQKDLESGKTIGVHTDVPEQRKSTVAIAKISQFRLKSRSNTPESKSSKGSSKSKSKSSHKSKAASKSTSIRKSKYTPEENKHHCRCREETLDLMREIHLKNEEPDTLQSIPNVPSIVKVTKKTSKQEVVEVESDTLQSISIVPSNEEVTKKLFIQEIEEEEPYTLQSEPIVSSIIDVIVSNSVTDDINTEDVFEPQIDEGKKSETNIVELPKESEPRNVSDDFRKGLTDKEVFEKLLESYEKKDNIATRLSKDDDFFNSQIDSLRKQSDESFGGQSKLTGKGSKIFSNDPHRSTHFWEEKMRQMRTKEDNPVKADDIGVCFARGFRPDNITLSGDACFNLNKQDKLTFSEKMLSDQESIIDFSERETPLDYLLALGFMVDEASNALKDEDIRSRLLAAITEARVWVNKITTTQGTLLYLVAYKSRPKTMRYFLQLVEAIINRRINNAIKLDGFLRILEQVEEGEIQMINILGAEKFEDEESEEKIVRKQLKQLFITVYKIAEHESFQRGKPLSQESILLLRILAAKYRAGLHPHLELIARYIGQELLTTETQLEAAMIFLSRLDTAEVKLKEFEAYCDIRCEKKKKTEEKLEFTDSEKTKSTETERTKSTEKTKSNEKTKTTEKTKSKK